MGTWKSVGSQAWNLKQELISITEENDFFQDTSDWLQGRIVETREEEKEEIAV